VASEDTALGAVVQAKVRGGLPMRSVAHAATMRRMNQPSKTVQLLLRLTTDAQTVSGSLQGEDGHRLSFWGWLELMDALQRLVGGESNGKPGHPMPGGPRT
jgi:hypothetical protein